MSSFFLVHASLGLPTSCINIADRDLVWSVGSSAVGGSSAGAVGSGLFSLHRFLRCDTVCAWHDLYELNTLEQSITLPAGATREEPSSWMKKTVSP